MRSGSRLAQVAPSGLFFEVPHSQLLIDYLTIDEYGRELLEELDR